MNNGLYAAYLGMRARQRALDVIANNIANASTTGFKSDFLAYRSIEEREIAALQAQQQKASASSEQSNAPTVSNSSTSPNNATTNQANGDATSANPRAHALGVNASGAIDFSPSAIRQTGRALDVALDGEGFLTVQTARGVRYTRAGALTLDASGQLTTLNGDLVIGQSGAITVPRGDLSIGEDGTISVNGRSVGQLKIVRFANPNEALTKDGGALFAPVENSRALDATQTRVISGALEASNVNSITELAAMMQNTREFESLQRSITMMMSDLGRKTTSEIGKI
jgi:flagellar basal-body rod protein FlgF